MQHGIPGRLRRAALHAARWTLWLVSAAVLALTLVSIASGDRWWVRALDFPRFQLVFLILALLVLVPAVLRVRARSTLALLLALLAALAFQAATILRYMPWHGEEWEAARACRPQDTLSVLALNLGFHNRQPEPVRELLSRVRADLFLAIELTPFWQRELESMRALYPHALWEAREDAWGIGLYARLPLEDARIHHPVEDYVPAVRALVHLRSGARAAFHGVHPKPPYPGHNTGLHDAALQALARAVADEPFPAIAAGDFNDVPWAPAMERMKLQSGLLDPRVGRGPLPTFNANLPGLRWPIDHVLATQAFGLLAFRRLPDVGSDHFPVFARLCLPAQD